MIHLDRVAITADLRLDHPPERVWRALTEPDRIADWLMPGDFRAVVGHRFTFQTRPIPPHFHGVVHGEVLVVEPPCRLVYSWRGGGLDTTISFHLEADGDGAMLHFEHGGFDRARPEQDAAYRGMEPGWTGHIMDRLRRTMDALPAA